MKGKTVTNGAGAAIVAFTVFTNAYTFLPGAFSGSFVWISHIAASIIFCFLLWCFISVCEKYPGESFYGVIENVLGSFFGKAVAAVLALLALLTLTVSLTVFSRFVQITALPRTPQIILPTLTVVSAALSLRSCLRAASGTARLLIWFFIAVFLVFVATGIGEMKFSLLLPWEAPDSESFKAVGEIYLNRFATAAALMSVYTRMPVGKTRKKWFLGSAAISGICLAVISVFTIATLGKSAAAQDFYPVFSAMSVKGVGGFIRHTEILSCIAMTFSLFFKSVVCILFSDDMLSGISKSRENIGAYIPIGLIAASFTQIIYRDTSSLRGLLEWKSGAIFILILHILIPIVVVFSGKLRRKRE